MNFSGSGRENFILCHKNKLQERKIYGLFIIHKVNDKMKEGTEILSLGYTIARVNCKLKFCSSSCCCCVFIIIISWERAL